jgi:hypothetical protein
MRNEHIVAPERIDAPEKIVAATQVFDGVWPD